MDTLSQQIIDMLNKGISWRQIQRTLSISSKKIQQVKNEFPDHITFKKITAGKQKSESESVFQKESGSASAFPGGINPT